MLHYMALAEIWNKSSYEKMYFKYGHFLPVLNGCTLQKRCEYRLVIIVLLVKIKKKKKVTIAFECEMLLEIFQIDKI
jgi:hypothetical protein